MDGLAAIFEQIGPLLYLSHEKDDKVDKDKDALSFLFKLHLEKDMKEAIKSKAKHEIDGRESSRGREKLPTDECQAIEAQWQETMTIILSATATNFTEIFVKSKPAESFFAMHDDNEINHLFEEVALLSTAYKEIVDKHMEDLVDTKNILEAQVGKNVQSSLYPTGWGTQRINNMVIPGEIKAHLIHLRMQNLEWFLDMTELMKQSRLPMLHRGKCLFQQAYQKWLKEFPQLPECDGDDVLNVMRCILPKKVGEDVNAFLF